MTIFQALTAGIVQGLTEFLPVSSTGHLVLLHRLFGVTAPQVAFDVFLHLGTLIAVAIFFYKDIISLLTDNKKGIAPVLVATVITAAAILPFKNALEESFSSVLFIGLGFLITGAWLFIPYMIRPKKTPGKNPTLIQSIAIGVAQAISAIPSISRSGATIATGMMVGVEREEAFKFSFLISIPAVGGAVLLECRKMNALPKHELTLYLAGSITAFVVGFVTLKLLSGIIKKGKLYVFGIYCVALGILTLIVR